MTRPVVVLCGVGAHGWFESRLSLAAWALHGRRIAASVIVVSVHLDGDLA